MPTKDSSLAEVANALADLLGETELRRCHAIYSVVESLGASMSWEILSWAIQCHDTHGGIELPNGQKMRVGSIFLRYANAYGGMPRQQSQAEAAKKPCRQGSMAIKYRAYNTKLRKMAEVIAIELDPEFGGVFVWGKGYVDHETLEHDADRDFWSWDDCVLMEHTGLGYGKGREVYKDDLIMAAAGRLFQVIWNESAYCWDLRALTSVGAPMGFQGLRYAAYKIIGNVHQNPDLAKETKQHG